MTAEEFEQSERCYEHWNKYEFAEAYSKQENEAKDKQIAELKAENNKLKSILNSPSKGDY